ncbi:hypothetical protein C8T65DRAFT_744485 [Cerioporus squamosus]|nr:hypothetical protein C8T65DRAFT_744485 [Cerioporus squamosus]
MATLLLHTYAPAPRQGILLNPSPAASPAYHPASLPALVPSNSSLSSSSSSAPGDVSDYFSSSSASPSPGPSHSSPAPRNAHLQPTSKPRHGSNPGTVRRIRFAPLPEPRREDDEDYPAVFLDDDEAGPSHTGEHIFAMSALAAAVNCPLPESVPSSPCATRRMLPPTSHDALGLDPSLSQSSADSSEPGVQQSQPSSVPSDVGQEWDMVSQSAALPALSLSLSVPDSPRKTVAPRAHLLARGDGVYERRRAARPQLLFLSAGSRNSSVSRDTSLSRERRDSDFGAPLHRWTSEGGPNSGLPVSKKKKHMLFGGSSSNGGVPLGRTQSLTSLSGKDDKKAKAQPVVVTNGGRKQQRMLNGRVYGARRKPNANPFANVRTDEPEFVEWGYGGMGSVKNASGQNSMWSRVAAGDDAAGLARKSADEDDGSGTAWVKRRREQRERERKEREEREKAEAEAKAKEKGAAQEAQERGADVAAAVEEQKEDGDTTIQADAPVDPSAVPLPVSMPSTPIGPDTPKLEHITQAINIPAPHHRHHHSHSHSHSHHHHGHHHTLSMPFVERRESAEIAHVVPVSSPSKVASEEGTPVPASARLRTESEGSVEVAERASVSSSGASAMSSTSDDADEESPKDTEGGFGQEEDEDEEDEELERSRLTALGAGVEKIARHHKDKEEQSAVGTPAAE